MNRKRIVTIAGKPGSGKSTTSKKIAAELGYEHFSSGDLFRAIAKERNIDIYQANVLAETEKDIDYQVDEKLKNMGLSENELVIDSRMAWHWMPYSFKIYLDLDLEVAATRILAEANKKRLEAEEIPETPTEYAERLTERLDSETKRYKALYNVNPYNTSNYDLVIDTEKNDPGQVVQIALTEYKKWLDT